MAQNQQPDTRTKELAREYEKKMAAREREIKARVDRQLMPLKTGPHELRNFTVLFHKLYTPAFREGKYQTPSEFFSREMPWIYGTIVYPRFREAFDRAVDRVREYPYSIGWGRRSFRSEQYLSYGPRIARIVTAFQDAHCLDADICDVLTGNLPEDAFCYLSTRNTRTAGFTPEVLADALDRDNPRLEAIVTDIINGDSAFARVSRELIRGIVMSHNPRMHQLLCRLLLAARLQEGLRQAICEDADWGTVEAFRAILTTILDNDLIRYSSVKRAVGTWIGVMTEETRDLERVSGKTLALIRDCLADPAYREECLASEDSMAIHIALWSDAFENVRRGFQNLDRLLLEGTHHQVLTAGYFVQTLEELSLRQQMSRAVLKARRDRHDILAVYLPSFLPLHSNIARGILQGRKDERWEQYFETAEEAAEFCDWLLEVHGSMKKKELEFNPCIFPWFAASLKKSELVEKAILIAVMTGDRQRIDRLCGFLSDCEAFWRDYYFKLLTRGEKTPTVRRAIIDALADKSADTRQAAYERARGMALAPEEYRQIEEMLRLRYDDLRRNALALLLEQEDRALEATLRRLLGSAKQQIRTAGLDLVTQLAKSEDRKGVALACMDAVHAIPNPTTQERILIDALKPREGAAQPLCTEADRYVPVISVDGYAGECIRAFQAVFPDSRLEHQVRAGKPVTHGPIVLPALPAETAKKARRNLQSLSDYIVANEHETFEQAVSGRTTPVGAHYRSFFQWTEDRRQVAPRMDLWERWQTENRITEEELLAMAVLARAQNEKYPYLTRCGRYIRDLFGSGFEKPLECRYQGHIQMILDALLREQAALEKCRMLALALGIWIARCLPEDMILGDGGTQVLPEGDCSGMTVFYPNEQARINAGVRQQLAGPMGHFIAHPQIKALLQHLEPGDGENRRYTIPVFLDVYQRTFASTNTYLENHGQTAKDRVTLLLDQIYQSLIRGRTPQFPDAATYLHARHVGLISERSLYYHLMEPGFFMDALKLVTSVCAMRSGEGDTVSAKTLFSRTEIRRAYEGFIGEDPELSEEQRQLVALCRRTAEKLVPVVLEAELRRGDTPTEYSAYVKGIHMLTGMETFVRILAALGKDSLDRSVYYWGSSQSKRGNLSYLLARCAPGAGDDAQKLAKLLRGTDISEKRLVEAALYNPVWIDIIGEYLNYPGFKSACYYFMAHMNERFDEQKKAVIARYTPLSEDELNLGAFDVEWFRSAYGQLGETRFELIYDAAKYISDGSKHTRARKYADAALGRLDSSETEAAIRDKRNKDLLMAYAIIPLAGEEDLIHRYLYLQQFARESRQFGAQRSASEKKAVEAALRNLATNAGFSDTMRLTLRMETRLVEENREIFAEKQVGEWTFRLHVDELGAVELRCRKDGKLLKSVPAKAKKEPYVVRLQDMKKQLTEQYRRTRKMFEQAMEDGTAFTLAEMRQLWENPVVAPIVSKLVFRAGEKLGFFDGNTVADLAGNVVADDPASELTVAHPLHLFRSGKWPEFQKQLYDNRIVQPFRQVFRELYVKTAEELGCVTSLRYAGHQIQPKKAAACLKERRWVADIEAGLQKVYYRENIVATIFALADWFTPADIEAPTLEHVAFYDRGTGQALKINEIPEVIFSEVMRDVDMVVSVAHVGGVDPEASHSTVEMREAILSFVLPLLRIENVRLEKGHAFVDGKLGRYSIHLGSGVVHQLGGAMLMVLPVHSQHRGRFFLPFVDDDPKTAEIISKVILFAEDHKLKDPSILGQISRV